VGPGEELRRLIASLEGRACRAGAFGVAPYTAKGFSSGTGSSISGGACR
jgi:hypothetical protein